MAISLQWLVSTAGSSLNQESAQDTQSAAYRIVESIYFEDMMCRSDISYRAGEREKENRV
jgi:phosphoribosylamine-glycine ligase